MKMGQSVPKRWHIKFRRRGITQKKAHNIQNTAKVWNEEYFSRSAILRPPKGARWVVGKMELKRISSTEVWMGLSYGMSLCDLSAVTHHLTLMLPD